MPLLFDYHGDNLDRGFVNLREAELPVEQRIHEVIEEMWRAYEPYADPDFRAGFARDLDARFWELYLAYTLLDEGHRLLPVTGRQRAGGQPDICVVEDERRIWIEAIAPTIGEPGPDQVAIPVPINRGGRLTPAPQRQAQLRTTSAFWTKVQIVRDYMAQGIIGQNDVRIIAIGAGRFGAYAGDDRFPLVISSLFPFGNEYFAIDRETGNVVEAGFRHAPVIERDGPPIPRTAFLDPAFADISGVLWSRVSIGAMTRPLAYLHNPLAQIPLPVRWSAWDSEFMAESEGNGMRITNILAADPGQQDDD